MAQAIVTIKVMPNSPEVDLIKLEEACKSIIAEFDTEVGKLEREPVAFGLIALNLTFVIDEAKGTEELEGKLTEIEAVQSAKVIDYRRALG